jgi:hypothetical protein
MQIALFPAGRHAICKFAHASGSAIKIRKDPLSRKRGLRIIKIRAEDRLTVFPKGEEQLKSELPNPNHRLGSNPTLNYKAMPARRRAAKR